MQALERDELENHGYFIDDNSQGVSQDALPKRLSSPSSPPSPSQEPLQLPDFLRRHSTRQYASAHSIEGVNSDDSECDDDLDGFIVPDGSINEDDEDDDDDSSQHLSQLSVEPPRERVPTTPPSEWSKRYREKWLLTYPYSPRR